MAIVNNKSFRLWFSSVDAVSTTGMNTGALTANTGATLTWTLGEWCPPHFLEDRPNRRWYIYPRSFQIAADAATWTSLGSSMLSVYCPTLSSPVASNSWSSGQTGATAAGTGNLRTLPKEWGNVILFQGITEAVSQVENQQDLDAVGIEIKNPAMLSGGNEFQINVGAFPAIAADVASFGFDEVEMNFQLNVICQEWDEYLDNPRPPIGVSAQMGQRLANTPSIANINPVPNPRGMPTQSFPHI